MTFANAGTVQVQNLSGAQALTVSVSIADPSVAAGAVITGGIQRDNHSAAGVFYLWQVKQGSINPGVGFDIECHRQFSANFGNNEGFTFHYSVFNP